MEAQRSPRPRLVLETPQQTAELAQAQAQDGVVLTLGKDPESDVVVDADHASRQHAFIESHRNDFYLVDTSTNGTFVQTEDERVQFVHRDRVRLWGVGWISLGIPLHQRRPILFRETVGS